MKEIAYEERKRIYERAIFVFGEGAQILKTLEEFAELQEALLKYNAGRDTVEHIAEEIADVTIMLEQLRLIFSVNAAVKATMADKLSKLERRIKEGGTRRASDG